MTAPYHGSHLLHDGTPPWQSAEYLAEYPAAAPAAAGDMFSLLRDGILCAAPGRCEVQLSSATGRV